jgi:multidrug resistance efflux pump
MKEDADAENVKSEEVQAIIDRMPTYWAKYVSLLTAVLIGLVIVAGFIIRYPDTVDGQISVTSSIAPVRMVSNTSGRLHLLAENKSMIQAGDVIACIESGANYRDVLSVDSLLSRYTPETDNADLFPYAIEMGDLSTAYNSFVMARTEYMRIKGSDIYETMRKIINRQIASDKSVVSYMGKELTLKKHILLGSAVQLDKDEKLLSMLAITEDEFESKLQQHLSREESFMNLRSNISAKQSDINRNALEIERNVLEEKELNDKALSELTSAANNLTNMIRLWKEKYLHIASIDGELEYLGFWRENSFVSSGQELFTLIPRENDVVGEVMIPSIGAGKVEVGQAANVKINKFPYDEYGLLKGRVESLSRISNRIDLREGTMDVYQVIISFPNGFTTNFGIPLYLDFETKGTVEIITKPKRLIARLFDNLKAKKEK